MNNITKRIADAIRCLSVGDSFGYPCEFVREFTGKEHIPTGFNITDDTQMTLYGLEAVYQSNQSGYPILNCIKDSYVAWYNAQNGSSSSYSPLSLIKEINSVRSPGNTCMISCHALSQNKPVHNDSMGCGSVMRVLPFLLCDNSHDVFVDSGVLTHKHHLTKLACSRLHSAYINILANDPVDDIFAKQISDLGEGWVATECVDMAAWAYSTSESFDELLRKTILHPGDSDSVAAVACSLWGLSGKDGWQNYYDMIKEKDIIEYFLEKYLC